LLQHFQHEYIPRHDQASPRDLEDVLKLPRKGLVTAYELEIPNTMGIEHHDWSESFLVNELERTVSEILSVGPLHFSGWIHWNWLRATARTVAARHPQRESRSVMFQHFTGLVENEPNGNLQAFISPLRFVWVCGNRYQRRMTGFCCVQSLDFHSPATINEYVDPIGFGPSKLTLTGTKLASNKLANSSRESDFPPHSWANLYKLKHSRISNLWFAPMWRCDQRENRGNVPRQRE